MPRYAIAAAALATVSFWLSGCSEKEVKAQRPGPTDVFDTIAGMGRCAALVNALQVAGLVDTLKGPGPFTIFAPTDDAFASLPEGELDRLLKRPEELKAIAEKGAGVEHPTVKPVDLMRWLARLVTPPGGTILEPFAGSGSTLVAAHAEGFRVIAVEQSPAYCDIITARMAQVAPDLEALRRGETETES